MNDKIVNEVLNENKEKCPYLKNIINAFLWGGSICLIGEVLFFIFFKIIRIDEINSRVLMYGCLIIGASILTGLGIYDKIGNLAGAGTIIPITGFSNSMTSAGIEGKTEGIIVGVFSTMFKLAGAIIASGVSFGLIIGFLKYLVSIL